MSRRRSDSQTIRTALAIDHQRLGRRKVDRRRARDRHRTSTHRVANCIVDRVIAASAADNQFIAGCGIATSHIDRGNANQTYWQHIDLVIAKQCIDVHRLETAKRIHCPIIDPHAIGSTEELQSDRIVVVCALDVEGVRAGTPVTLKNSMPA